MCEKKEIFNTSPRKKYMIIKKVLFSLIFLSLSLFFSQNEVRKNISSFPPKDRNQNGIRCRQPPLFRRHRE